MTGGPARAAPAILKTVDPGVIPGWWTDRSSDEFSALQPSLLTGWATVHGYPVGIRHVRGLRSAEAAVHPVATGANTPLLFPQNTTGYMVVATTRRPASSSTARRRSTPGELDRPAHTVTLGASYGAGNYGMCGRSFNPRFLFTWQLPTAVMGPAQWPGSRTDAEP